MIQPLQSSDTPKKSEATGNGTRAEIWAWAMCDWANSAYSTLSITVLMFYISGVVFAGNAGVLAYGYVISGTTLLAAVLSPVLGAAADAARTKRLWLGLTTLPAACAALGMCFVSPDNPWLVVGLYAVANLGYELSYGFYNGFLPEIADERSMNRVSSFGFGLGYIGGGLALLLAMLLIMLGGKLGLPEGSVDHPGLTADYHSAASGEFSVAVPPGRYRVELFLGDPAKPRDPVALRVAGESFSARATARGEFLSNTLEATVGDEPLHVTLETSNATGLGWAANGLRVSQLGAETDKGTEALDLLFDFGTAGSSAEPGSVWVLPGDKFVAHRLLDGDAPRYKPRGPAARKSLRQRGQATSVEAPDTVPEQLTFGWTRGTIRARDAVMPLRLQLGLGLMGVWWGLFSLPALIVLRDRGQPRQEQQSWGQTASGAFRQVLETLASVRRFPMLFLFLIAFLVYNDGVQTVITQAGPFAKQVLAIEAGELTQVVLMIQFLAWPGAWLVGKAADRLGNKPILLACIAVYVAWLCGAFFISAKWQFWCMGAVLALVMGGIQSVSRAIMAMMTPAERSGEFFGFFNLSGKATSGVGPFMFASILAWSNSPHLAVLSLLVFFVVGAALLVALDVARGKREAQSGV